MTDLTPGTQITEANVRELEAGDVLEVLDTEEFTGLIVGERVEFLHLRESLGSLLICHSKNELGHYPRRFAFVRRPAPSAVATPLPLGGQHGSPVAGDYDDCLADQAVETPSAEGEVAWPVLQKLVADLIEKQADDFATGLQDRQFLRDDSGSEPLGREMVRLNLEQFAKRLAALSPSAAACECEALREALKRIAALTDDRVSATLVGVNSIARQALHAGEPG